MALITGDDRWYQVLDRINTAVYAELTVKPQRYGVVEGLIAWDDCSCGLLATTWAIIFGSDVFPQEAIGITGNCDTAWEVMEAAVQVIRCAPTPPTGARNKLAPAVADLAAAAKQMAMDVVQARRGSSKLLCTMKDSGEITDYMVRRHSVLGPEGGCVGFELRMYVALPRSL